MLRYSKGMSQSMVCLVVAALGMSISGAVAWARPVTGSQAPNMYRAFVDPRAVTIQGYSGDAMEPFISRHGAYLLFNTSNVPPHIASLQFASRINDQTFVYRGQIQGVNEPDALSGTPSMDRDGQLYFVSTRSYTQTLSTIYTGRFVSGRVTQVHLVSGVSPRTPGIVDFDVEVSADGRTLYVSVGRFDGGTAPQSASLAIFRKVGSGFIADPEGPNILRAVNNPAMLTYAASVSTNGLELFFTRAGASGGVPAIYRAVRSSLSQPFGQVQRVSAITGFAEAPSISASGTTLYYHRLVGNHFEIADVTRQQIMQRSSWPRRSR